MFDRIAHQRLFLPTVTLAACGGLFSFLVFYNPDRAYYFLFSGLTLTILVTYTFWLFSLKKIKEKSRFTERRATAELEALVDTAVDGILAISKNGLIERFNPAAEKLFGYDKSEVIGRNVKILMPASYADEHDDYLHQYEATGIKKIIGIGRTVTGKRKDDTEFPMELSVGELPEPLNGYVGIIRDITERQYFEQSIKRATAEQAALVDTAVDAILSISENGNIERFNPAAEKLFGYQKSDVIGKNVKILMPDHYANEHDGYLDHYKTTGEKRIIGIGRTVTGKRKNGTEFPMDLSVGELPKPLSGYVGIIRDVTDRHNFEQRIMEHSRDLTRSNEDLAQFAYVASHDLKAPLRGIDNLAGWIDEKVGEYMDEECQSYMKLLRGRINRLEALLSSLLDYSRIGRVDTKTQNLNINDLLQDIIDLLTTDNFTITTDDFPSINAASAELNMLFQNLIGNAIKHHDKESGNIHVGCTRGVSSYIFSVHDDGPGIPENMADKVFNMFQTLKPRDQVEGSGMGLAFVKKIAERNNATVSVEKSKMERGAAVVITWPILKEGLR